MAKHLRTAGIAVGIIAAVVLLFLLIYTWLLPKLSYRRLVFSVTEEDAIASAEAIRDGKSVEISERQSIAIASWLAEYRSENEGITHTSSKEGAELWLHLADGRDVCLYVEQNEIIFPGILGHYSIAVESNEIFYLISELLS